MRLIDADYMRKLVDIHGTNKYGMLDENIRVFIDQQPSVDAVEVVRCGECTYRLVNSRGENKCWQDHDNGVNSLPLDWFCADGERKGEEE